MESRLPQKRFGSLCVFGSYEDSELYSRNRILINALSVHCDEVVEVRSRPRSGNRNNQLRVSSFGRLIQTAWSMVAGFFSLARQWSRLKGTDLYYVPYPAYIDLIFLRLLTWRSGRRVIVVDAFLCLHDTLVLDRRMIADKSVAARMVSWLERQTLRKADLVFIDTLQQKEELSEQYELNDSNVAVVPVGIDESIWCTAPVLPLKTQFCVLFWGTFIPLHGVDVIIGAAKLLQDSHPQIKIKLIGDGQTAPDIDIEVKHLGLDNIQWKRRLLSAAQLRLSLERAHCILGIFGPSKKAGDVIPYKAYQALASNKILISRSGPAFEALLNGKMNPGLFLVPPGDPVALAQAIVRANEAYSDILPALNTSNLYHENLSNSIIQERVSAALDVL